MTAPRVRADYDQVKGMASQFGGQAQAAQQTLQALQRDLDVLQGGDWVGNGASAFYAEMGSQVLPTLRRLANALASAQQTTLQIHQVMAQAEAEAARWLRGEGQGQPANGSGQAALFASRTGTTGGTGSGTPGPAPTGSPASGAAGGPGGSAAPPKDTPLAKPLADAVARILAEENAAVDQKLAGLSKNVRDIVKRSPTLRAQFLQIQKLGFNVQIVPPGASTTTWTPRQINIAQFPNDLDTVAHIAHEAGHAVNEPNLVQKYDDTTHDQYVGPNTAIMLRNEGLAAFNEAQVQAELKAVSGLDISSGAQAQAPGYRQAYADYVAGNLTREQALQRTTTLMAGEHRGPARNGTYASFYRELFQIIWDDDLDPPPMR